MRRGWWFCACIPFAAGCRDTRPPGTLSGGSDGASADGNAPAVVSAVVSALPPVARSGGAQADGPRMWNFDGTGAGAAPAGFAFGRTGGGEPGHWSIVASHDAPSAPNVLAQLAADGTDDRFPIAVVQEVSLADLRLRVRCRPVSGRVDQACGLVWRYRDENNYYLTRANALEGNIRFYTVRDGIRRQLASHSGEVASGRWHDYAIEAVGDRFRVAFDGVEVLDHRDSTFSSAGLAGVWTKADSVTEFDDLAMEPLP